MTFRRSKNPVFFLWVAVVGVSAIGAFAARIPIASSAAKAPAASVSSASSLWISKSDGALSCAPGTEQTLETGSAELVQAQIQVLESRKGSDGKLRAQVCGIAKGTSNAYRISRSDLARALALGFAEAK